MGMLDDYVAPRYKFRAVTTYPERGGVSYCLRFESFFVGDTFASAAFFEAAGGLWFFWFSVLAVIRLLEQYSHYSIVVVFARR